MVRQKFIEEVSRRPKGEELASPFDRNTIRNVIRDVRTYLFYQLDQPKVFRELITFFALYLVYAVSNRFLPVYVDFVTPWLITLAVVHSWRYVMPFAILAASAVESYASLPFGLYFTCYASFGVVLVTIKQIMSWNQTSWLATFFVSQVVLIAAETFHLFLITPGLELDWVWGLSSAARVIFTSIYAMTLSQTMILRGRSK